MTTLRIPSVKLLMVAAIAILCVPPFLDAQEIAANTQAGNTTVQATAGASETRTGCLSSGNSAGTYLLLEDSTGQKIAIVSPAIAALKMDQRVNATGLMVRRDNIDVFQATKVEPLNAPCQLGFSTADLKRSIGHAHVGVQGGITLDPTLISLGGHIEFGPIFRNLWVRPSMEFAFGEVTKIYSITPEFVYYLPFIGIGADQSRFNMYAGAGAALSIARRSFSGFPEVPVESVSDWDGDVGLTLFVGMSQKNGMFYELKTTAYSPPVVRLYIGYRFK